MRVRGLALLGLIVGAFVGMASPATATAAAASSTTATSSQSLDRLFSSDGPESLHEAKNQGTRDEPKAWPEANAWLHAQLSESERGFLSLTATGPTTAPTTPPTTPPNGNYCTANPTACLNGGTCIAGATASTYTCTCASGFIGAQCQFSLFGSNKRRAGAVNAAGIARGKSVTRPSSTNAAAVKPRSS